MLLDTLKRDEAEPSSEPHVRELARTLLTECHELAQIVVTCPGSTTEHRVYQETGIRAAIDRTMSGLARFLADAKAECSSSAQQAKPAK